MQQGGVDELLAPSSGAPGMHITTLLERISGSGELAPTYDAAVVTEREARERSLHHYQKKRALAAERKQFKEQKLEADKWQELQDKAREQQVQAALARLWEAQTNLEKIQSGQGSLQEQLNSLAAKETTLNAQVEADRKAQANAQKEALALGKKLRTQEKGLDGRHPEALRAKEALRQAERALEEAAREEKRLASQRSEQQAKVKTLRGDLQELQRQEEQQETQWAQQLKAEKQVVLNSDDEAEYARLQAEAGKGEFSFFMV